MSIKKTQAERRKEKEDILLAMQPAAAARHVPRVHPIVYVKKKEKKRKKKSRHLVFYPFIVHYRDRER